MNTLPEDIQDTIYKYKHQIEFIHVMVVYNDIINFWCEEHLLSRYCISRHNRMRDYEKNEFICLKNICLRSFKCKDILNIINETY